MRAKCEAVSGLVGLMEQVSLYHAQYRKYVVSLLKAGVKLFKAFQKHVVKAGRPHVSDVTVAMIYLE